MNQTDQNDGPPNPFLIAGIGVGLLAAFDCLRPGAVFPLLMLCVIGGGLDGLVGAAVAAPPAAALALGPHRLVELSFRGRRPVPQGDGRETPMPAYIMDMDRASPCSRSRKR